VLGGRVVEKVSGMSLADFLRTRIFEPIGMTHAALDPSDDTPWIAHGHSAFALGDMKPAAREAAGWLGGAGGAFASPIDLAKWDLALVDGKVLGEKAYARMTTPRALSNGKGRDYGCGIGVRRRLDRTILTHSGAVSGFLAYNAVVPASRSAVVLMVNEDTIDPSDLYDKILTLLLQDLAEADVPKVAGPPAKDVALKMFHDMQNGTIDRSALGEELSIFLSDAVLKESAPRLRAMGEPKRVEVKSLAERGAMQVAWIAMTFAHDDVTVGLYRTPDGKVQEMLLLR
jgi:CubicO group peptidase (beta-lactamase class C family)